MSDQRCFLKQVGCLTLKADVAKLMGSLFGNETEKMFLEYYDDAHPAELMKACKEMMTKMVGPAATHKHCEAMVKNHPEIKKIAEALK